LVSGKAGQAPTARHDTVDLNGKLTLQHPSRQHHIGLGRRHAGKTVLMLVHDLYVRIITTNGTPLRDFQLDPTRDYQPQPKKVNDVPRHL
jgi:hypothetical protein